ncbi:MAG: hypothetical protein ACK4IY_00990 [Chitinophagales bacterium]
MDNQRKDIAALHREIVEWKELIMLVRDEILIFEHQLGELLATQHGMEVMQHVQRFESQFIRHKEVSDELFHDLKIADHQLKVILERNTESDEPIVEDHVMLRDKVHTYERLFNELKEDYRHFLAAVVA